MKEEKYDQISLPPISLNPKELLIMAISRVACHILLQLLQIGKLDKHVRSLFLICGIVSVLLFTVQRKIVNTLQILTHKIQFDASHKCCKIGRPKCEEIIKMVLNKMS
jgi:hypothetical protein